MFLNEFPMKFEKPVSMTKLGYGLEIYEGMKNRCSTLRTREGWKTYCYNGFTKKNQIR